MLLSERIDVGHWIGELASSALSTATAVSALTIFDRQDRSDAHRPMVQAACEWLIADQNVDGGWGDTIDSVSNLSTTILVRSALQLAAGKSQPAVLQSADDYVQTLGGYGAVQARYGRDKTFAVPILTNAALAGLVDWNQVNALPFELAVFPQSWYRFLQMPVVSYAIPALVAIGQARFFQQPPRNPVLKALRSLAVSPSLEVLSRMQPGSGGYLEAIPLTSFVLMSLAATGRADHVVSFRAAKFLRATARPDGSWPIDSNLATWNTTLAINALGTDGWDWQGCLPWLLSCQHQTRHPFTGSPPGGWGWSDLSGAVPDADDTPGALLALAKMRTALSEEDVRREQIRLQAASAVTWLLNLQNRDGGWPTFCRGWGKLPFDRSGCDLTAHAIRALHAWRPTLPNAAARIDRATTAGFAYLARQQRPNGSWLPLWFGNQFQPGDENPIYGTSRVLLAFADLGRANDPQAVRGTHWLVTAQNEDGGWGHAADGANSITSTSTGKLISSIEETAVAVEALLRMLERQPSRSENALLAIRRGLQRLTDATTTGEIRRASPIGLYFAKLWYHERLYPLTFGVSALRAAVESPFEFGT